MTDQHAPFLFVIDTADYAGNFERQMCAYLTGRLGECEVGREYVEMFKTETGQEPLDNILDEGDEHGCARPVSIYATPGYFNHGYGGNYPDTPESEAEALIDYRECVREHHGNSLWHGYLKAWRAGDTEGYAKAGWTEEKLIKACADEEKRIVEADAMTKPHKWPAYQSVAISFGICPTPDQIVLMKERALKFSALPGRWNKGEGCVSKILGFRLIEQTKKVTASAV